MKSSLLRIVASIPATVLIVGCAADGPLLEPTSEAVRPSAEVSNEPQPPKTVTLCKLGPAGTSATFSISATGGVLPYGTSTTLTLGVEDDPMACIGIWQASEPQGNPDVIQTLTVTETAHSAGTTLAQIVTLSDLDGWTDAAPPVKSATVRVNYANGAIIWFKNVEAPGGGGGSAGCTPGFWKQSQHFQYWTAPYTPSTLFGSVFANAFPGKTLLQIAGQGGGGLNALGRHTVAALLNAASGEVDYGMTPADVIAAFNAAHASGDYEGQKNIFEGLNERGCTVDKSNTDSRKK